MAKIVYPNYDKSLLSIISSIKKYFNEEYPYASNETIDELLNTEKYKHITFMILDGLGSKVLEDNLDDEKILSKMHTEDLISIYPSTTAAATTAAISGLAPLESGWTGWQNYVKEINQNIVLFTGVNYFTNKQTNMTGYQILPVTPFWQSFPIYTSKIMPSFDKQNGVKNFSSGIKKLKKIWKTKEASFTYFYWGEPDSTMHSFGCDCSKSHKIINDLNKKIEAMYKDLPTDSLVIITADHGHINVEPINLTLDLKLNSMLKRRPSNDARAITFSVLDDKRKEFVNHFNELYKDSYILYDSNEFINKGFLGDTSKSKLNPRIKDFLGDYIAVAISNKYFEYNDDFAGFKSHHAGMTGEEMITPLIIIKK